LTGRGRLQRRLQPAARRKENIIKRVGYWTFYRLVAFLSDIRSVGRGDFCLIDRHVITAQALPERLRYPRVLRAWVDCGSGWVRSSEASGGLSQTAMVALSTGGSIATASIRPLNRQVSSFLFRLLAVTLMLVLILVVAGPLRTTFRCLFC
jgi:hypothetical protein